MTVYGAYAVGPPGTTFQANRPRDNELVIFTRLPPGAGGALTVGEVYRVVKVRRRSLYQLTVASTIGTPHPRTFTEDARTIDKARWRPATAHEREQAVR